MKLQSSRILCVLLASIAEVQAQSLIQTILGSAPDGVAVAVASLNTPAAVISDPDGNIYVALAGARQVVRIDSSGMVRVIAGTGTTGSGGDGGSARLAQLSQPCALALDSEGNLYVADYQAHRIRRVGSDGIISTFAGNGKSGSSLDGGLATESSLKYPAALAFDNSGNLLIADSGNHVVRMVTLDGRLVKVAGKGYKSSGGDEGPALEAGLNTPAGLAVDSKGNIYVADMGNNQIRVIAPDGMIDRFAGRDSSSSGGGFGGGSGDQTVPRNAVLYSPTALAMNAAGDLYFIESGTARIRRITADRVLGNYAGTGKAGAAGDGGLARSANLSPLGIGFDVRGNLLIADGANHRIRVVTESDSIIDTLAGNGLVTYDPRGLAVSGDIIYFSDTNNHRIRKFNTSTGEVALVAGDGQARFAGDGDSALTASLNSPRGIVLDSAGNLYIADSGNHRVRRVGPDGKITTVAGNGTGAVETDDGAQATSASLYEPVDVALDSAGALYIVERLGHRVRKATIGGSITTVAGTGAVGAPGEDGGPAVASPLNYPQAITVAPSGTLLVADSGNQVVRRIGADGSIKTVAGNNAAGFGRDGGPATEAFLNTPTGLAVDTEGNIYIGDTDNDVLRRVGADGMIATIAGMTSNRIAGFNGDGSPATQFSLYRPSVVIPYTDCTVLVADTYNQRIRRVWPAVDYTISTNAEGLQLMVDGKPTYLPVVVGWLPGTVHRIDAPESQDGEPGVRYLGRGGQDISVTCGPTRETISVSLETQYQLTTIASTGGSVSPGEAWLDAGTTVTAVPTADEGYVFVGWEGDCAGAEETCEVVMDSPKTLKANFSSTITRRIR